MKQHPFTFEQLLRLRLSYFAATASDSFRRSVPRTHDCRSASYQFIDDAASMRWLAVETFEAAVVAHLHSNGSWAEVQSLIPAGLPTNRTHYDELLTAVQTEYLFPIRQYPNNTYESDCTPEGLGDPLVTAARLDAWIYKIEDDGYSPSFEDPARRASPVGFGLTPDCDSLRNKFMDVRATASLMIAEGRTPEGMDRDRAWKVLLSHQIDFEELEPVTAAGGVELLDCLQDFVSAAKRQRLNPAVTAALSETDELSLPQRRHLKRFQRELANARKAVKPETPVSFLYRTVDCLTDLYRDTVVTGEVTDALEGLTQIFRRSSFAYSGALEGLARSPKTVAELLASEAAFKGDLLENLGQKQLVRLWYSHECQLSSDAARTVAIRKFDGEESPLVRIERAADLLRRAERVVDIALVADSRYGSNFEELVNALGSGVLNTEQMKARVLRLREELKATEVVAQLQRLDPDIGGPDVPRAFSHPAQLVKQLDQWCKQPPTIVLDSRWPDAGLGTTPISDGLRANRHDMVQDRFFNLNTLKRTAAENPPPGVTPAIAAELVSARHKELTRMTQPQQEVLHQH